MNYMEQIDAWFENQLARYTADGDTDAFKKAVKAKVLESFRNGAHYMRPRKEKKAPVAEDKQR